MKLLFIHQNFPGQFRHLASYLGSDHGHQVFAFSMRAGAQPKLPGVEVISYSAPRGSTPGIHPWVGDFESKVIRGEACFRKAVELRDQGYTPDIILGHPGWGECLFLKHVWPNAKLALYAEYYYRPSGSDVAFDPEFGALKLEDNCRLDVKNAIYKIGSGQVDAMISPTRWQASTFPDTLQPLISVIHDGIDTARLTPKPETELTLKIRNGKQIRVSKADEIVTFVTRNLEPYRGFHTFMRSLPTLLLKRPQARVLIVGGSDTSYGARAPDGRTWRDILVEEIGPKMSDSDWARVHFLGTLPYSDFVDLLRVSRVHVYLTYPFVLSWSLLEAMSLGCCIVASDTAPVREVIRDGENGKLTDFFNAEELANNVLTLLAGSSSVRQSMGISARNFVVKHFDLESVCLPAQKQWLETIHGTNSR